MNTPPEGELPRPLDPLDPFLVDIDFSKHTLVGSRKLTRWFFIGQLKDVDNLVKSDNLIDYRLSPILAVSL
tara:strand:- start:550 stop:762 length:213 start_codon:yes stop_codon:yes gene_type:complete